MCDTAAGSRWPAEIELHIRLHLHHVMSMQGRPCEDAQNKPLQETNDLALQVPTPTGIGGHPYHI